MFVAAVVGGILGFVLALGVGATTGDKVALGIQLGFQGVIAAAVLFGIKRIAETFDRIGRALERVAESRPPEG